MHVLSQLYCLHIEFELADVHVATQVQFGEGE